MVFIFFLSTGCRFEQKTDLGLVHFDNSFDFFRREVVDCAFFRFLPAKNVIGLCTDGVWLVIEIKIQLLQFVLFWGLVWNWRCVFLQFPFLQANIRKGEDFVYDFWIEDNFSEIFSLVDDLRNFFSSIFADYMDTTEMHFGISFVIDVLKFSDRICSRILFFVSLNGIDFYHLVGALPEDVNSGVVINGHDDSELQFFLVALFVSGKLQTWDFVSLGYFPFFIDFPGMQQFDFLLLEVWSDQSDIVFMGLDVLNYGF